MGPALAGINIRVRSCLPGRLNLGVGEFEASLSLHRRIDYRSHLAITITSGSGPGVPRMVFVNPEPPRSLTAGTLSGQRGRVRGGNSFSAGAPQRHDCLGCGKTAPRAEGVRPNAARQIEP